MNQDRQKARFWMKGAPSFHKPSDSSGLYQLHCWGSCRLFAGWDNYLFDVIRGENIHFVQVRRTLFIRMECHAQPRFLTIWTRCLSETFGQIFIKFATGWFCRELHPRHLWRDTRRGGGRIRKEHDGILLSGDKRGDSGTWSKPWTSTPNKEHVFHDSM